MCSRLLLLALTVSMTASASELIYRPTNPSFGGNPLNSSHLLGTANAQNDYKDPPLAAAAAPRLWTDSPPVCNRGW